jgi:hypothetical protein
MSVEIDPQELGFRRMLLDLFPGFPCSANMADDRLTNPSIQGHSPSRSPSS